MSRVRELLHRSPLRWTARIAAATLLAGAIVYVPYRLFRLADTQRLAQLSSTLEQLRQRNRALRSENEQLARDVARLEDNPQALEHVAREELGLVRPLDIVFQFE
jgi:cell division protein FtsB